MHVYTQFVCFHIQIVPVHKYNKQKNYYRELVLWFFSILFLVSTSSREKKKKIDDKNKLKKITGTKKNISKESGKLFECLKKNNKSKDVQLHYLFSLGIDMHVMR